MRFRFAVAIAGVFVPLSAARADDSGQAKSATPLGNPGQWVTTRDYPADALASRTQGTVNFSLVISPSGNVEACEIVVSSGSTLLDTATCSLVTARARFNPATDPAGHPVAGRYSNRVRWVVPTVRQPEPYELVTSAIVETDGTFTTCRIEKASPNALANEPGLARIADQCANRPAVTPYTDSAGKPVRRKVTSSVTVKIDPVH